jgi:hypothetical protein
MILAIIPEMYNKYPDNTIAMEFVITEPPIVEFATNGTIIFFTCSNAPTGFSATLYGYMTVFVNTNESQTQIFLLNMNLFMNGNVRKYSDFNFTDFLRYQQIISIFSRSLKS